MSNYSNFGDNKSSKGKSTKTALIITVFILVVVCAVLVTIIFMNQMNQSNSKTENEVKKIIVKEDTPSAKNDDTNTNTEEIIETKKEDTSVEIVPTEPSDSTKYITVEDYVSEYVRPRYKVLYDGAGLSAEKISPNTTAYYRSDGTLGKVIVKSGTGTNDERWFFYDEFENLIFVYSYESSLEYRYYYQFRNTVRYKGPDKVEVDYPTSSEVLTASRGLLNESDMYR